MVAHQFGGPDGVMPGAERLEGTTALPVKLRNKCNRDFQMWFESDPGSVGDRLASISPGEQEDTTSYPGHVFCFSKLNDEQGCRNAEFKITIKSGTSFYAVDDGQALKKSRASGMHRTPSIRSTRQKLAGIGSHSGHATL